MSQPSTPSQPRRHAPVWLFAITVLPFGVAAGFVSVALPFMLRQKGLDVERIAWIGSLALMPSSLQFLWAPILDIGPKRRSWLLILACTAAAAMYAALQLRLPDQLMPFVMLTVLGQGLVGLTGSCNGAIMATTLPDEVRGRAGGWYNAGNLGGMSIGGAVLLSLSERVSSQTLGLALAAMVIVPALAILAVEEVPRAARSARQVFGDMWHAVSSILTSRSGITGVLICISPVGTVAAMNLFSAVATDYHTSADSVALLNGVVGTVLNVAGCLIGGWACDRMSRRLAYLIAGGLTVVTSLGFMLAPITETSYIVGVSAYLLVSGVCYAAFTALVLEVIGTAGAAAATEYTLFSAAGNIAIAYTQAFDGMGYALLKSPRGLFAADALANGLGILLLGLLLKRVFGRITGAPVAPRAEPSQTGPGIA